MRRSIEKHGDQQLQGITSIFCVYFILNRCCPTQPFSLNFCPVEFFLEEESVGHGGHNSRKKKKELMKYRWKRICPFMIPARFSAELFLRCLPVRQIVLLQLSSCAPVTITSGGAHQEIAFLPWYGVPRASGQHSGVYILKLTDRAISSLGLTDARGQQWFTMSCTVSGRCPKLMVTRTPMREQLSACMRTTRRDLGFPFVCLLQSPGVGCAGACSWPFYTM